MSSYSITAVKINNFFKKTLPYHLSRLLRSLKILIAKVRRNERKFFPTTLTYLKTSKILKILKKCLNFSKFSKFSNSQNSQILKMSYYQRYFKFFFLLLAPHVTVPVVLWAEACPFASSSTESLSTTGLNVLCV